MKIRGFTAQDRADFLSMMDEFYHSNAVLHPIPKECMERCFAACIQGGPYLKGYLFEEDNMPAGFALVSTGFSTEAGGLCVQLEDLYVRAEFRGKGIGKQFFTFLRQNCPAGTRRLRLEVEPENENAIRLYQRLGFQTLPYLQMILDVDP